MKRRMRATPLTPSRWSWEGIALALLGSALWGLAPVATKDALRACSPDLVTTTRLAVSMVVFHACAGAGVRWLVSDRWIWIAGIALGLDFVMYSHGLQHTSASVAGLLVNVEPIATIGLAVWLLGERLTRHRRVGSLATLSGVLLVSADGVNFRDLGTDLRMLGNLLVAASALAWSVYAVAQRRTHIGTTLFHRLTPIFAVATLTSLPGLLLPGAFEVHPDPSGWLMLAILTLLCTGAVYLVYARAQQLMEVSALAILLSSIPVFTIGFATVILHEPLTPLVAIGCGLVTFGVVVIAREPAQQTGTLPPPAVPLLD